MLAVLALVATSCQLGSRGYQCPDLAVEVRWGMTPWGIATEYCDGDPRAVIYDSGWPEPLPVGYLAQLPQG